MLWETVDNDDGSIALRNRLTERFLDGDGNGADWQVDVSAEILADDGWFIDIQPAAK